METLIGGKQDAADFLAISTRLLDDLVKAGKIPHFRLGGRVMFDMTVLRAHVQALAESSVKATEPVKTEARVRRRRVVQPAAAVPTTRRTAPARPEAVE